MKWAAILCADWSKDPKKREVYAAWPGERRVGRLAPPAGRWTFDRVLEAAGTVRIDWGGSVLVGFDAPLGVPESYWLAVARAEAWLSSGGKPSTTPRHFVEWLRVLADSPGTFFRPVGSSCEWFLNQPFLILSPLTGSRSSFEAHLENAGLATLRRVDEKAGANSVFIAAGMAGVVGGSAIDLWQGIGQRLVARPDFAVWPFDGLLEAAATAKGLVVAEIYPRLAYALAAAPTLTSDLAPLAVAKGNQDIRSAFIDLLSGRDAWPRRLGVRLNDLSPAQASEDAFDAFVTAAGLLRCELEGAPFSDPTLEDAIAEGGILGSGGVNLDLREVRFKGAAGVPRHSPQSRRARVASVSTGTALYRCPIPGCTKEFQGSVGGWDGHVGSLRLHPKWHPAIRRPDQRRDHFRAEFAGFFRGTAS